MRSCSRTRVRRAPALHVTQHLQIEGFTDSCLEGAAIICHQRLVVPYLVTCFTRPAFGPKLIFGIREYALVDLVSPVVKQDTLPDQLTLGGWHVKIFHHNRRHSGSSIAGRRISDLFANAADADEEIFGRSRTGLLRTTSPVERLEQSRDPETKQCMVTLPNAVRAASCSGTVPDMYEPRAGRSSRESATAAAATLCC